MPIPKDYSGGYTHETHKKNCILMQKAGVLYQILDDEKYAKYVKDMLLQYAKHVSNITSSSKNTIIC